MSFIVTRPPPCHHRKIRFYEVSRTSRPAYCRFLFNGAGEGIWTTVIAASITCICRERLLLNMYEIRGLSSIVLFMFVREQCQDKLQSALLFFLYFCSPAHVWFIRTQLDFLFTWWRSCWVLLIWTVMILNVSSLSCMCSFVMQGIMLMPALRFKICMYLWRVLIMASYIMHSSYASVYMSTVVCILWTPLMKM